LQTPEGAQIIAISRSAGLAAVDARSGALRWEIPTLLSKRCVASPIITRDGLIIAQCGEGRAESFVYAVRPPRDGKPAEKVYEVIRTGGYVPTPIAVGDYLFLWKEDGLVTCLRAATNEQIWSERVQGPFYGSPVCVNNRLYNMSRKGDLVVVNASDKFAEVARVPLGEGSHATPAVSGGRIYLRTFSHLISVGK
jgi:outer membrane protein assembly factor BamB